MNKREIENVQRRAGWVLELIRSVRTGWADQDAQVLVVEYAHERDPFSKSGIGEEVTFVVRLTSRIGGEPYEANEWRFMDGRSMCDAMLCAATSGSWWGFVTTMIHWEDGRAESVLDLDAARRSWTQGQPKRVPEQNGGDRGSRR